MQIFKLNHFTITALSTSSIKCKSKVKTRLISSDSETPGQNSSGDEEELARPIDNTGMIGRASTPSSITAAETEAIIPPKKAEPVSKNQVNSSSERKDSSDNQQDLPELAGASPTEPEVVDDENQQAMDQIANAFATTSDSDDSVLPTDRTPKRKHKLTPRSPISEGVNLTKETNKKRRDSQLRKLNPRQRRFVLYSRFTYQRFTIITMFSIVVLMKES